MSKSLFNFRDDDEREMFIVAIPVILFFGLLGYFLMKGEAPEAVAVPVVAAVADFDGDGVSDATDQCVNTAGLAANYGCPADVAWADRDNDADGIKNGIDSCPETKGVAEQNGCAAQTTEFKAKQPIKVIDTDGDGFADSEDACPDVAGSNGSDCPADRDADGVIDSEDKCPDVAGSAEAQGCVPDPDNDGVLGCLLYTSPSPRDS